ncbi:hypothetical protein BU24DRAFT_362964 [Aaosphaeria arxii CBS 175.79]|uniref:Zn(2)-C6 fungal-type domain-containing protein n=1 Tax=Aaosphaeria arxii CBS 175.79 TaxID=1450172 RepID=A0A6A5YAF0_9PLEO|nr:uncharacterized protein BU24DRAFT_362964 [Aaosphaeria arxii CBS 175.79]KAF2021997.1 hypothetical protein BU24DRAFT_362964 [Aaosphaeria arxii CBS 175.79]
MPKARSTCTRCSQRRQKCNRETPCSRCVKNNEAHLCTTEWRHGYDPSVHRKYPRKSTPSVSGSATGNNESDMLDPVGQDLPINPINDQGVAAHNRLQSTVDRTRLHPHSTSSNQSQDVTPAPAENIDFITFGRSEFTDISIASLLTSKGSYVRHKALMEQALGQDQGPGKQADVDGLVGGFSPAARAVEAYHIQSLVPAKEQVLQMVKYHEDYMLYWTGGIYHGPNFYKSVLAAYGQSNTMNLSSLDWRWTALLFSIMTSTIIACPDRISATWGYPSHEKLRLAKQWGNATIACLNLGDYASKHHIYSVQAIINMHCSEHLIGATKEWAVYQSGAVTIARGLNLHRLGPHPDDNKRNLTPEQKESLLQREMGRRIWCSLVSQDWICSTSQGYYTIQQKHFTSTNPRHYNDDTMEPILNGDPPVPTHVNVMLNEVSRVIIQHQDDMLAAPDQASRYRVVLEYDGKLRALLTGQTPYSISRRTPIKPTWPKWVAWARRLHRASISHKLIMVHQAFLNPSFKSPQYTYSRWACATAAKQVIEEMTVERDPEEPQWWVEHAFVVTAGICLALDVFHRPDTDSEVGDYLSWVERASKSLEQWPNSSVAVHGIRLLTSLVQEYHKKTEASRPHRPASNSYQPLPHVVPSAPVQPVATESAQMPTPDTEGSLPTDGWAIPSVTDIDMEGFEDLMDTLPLEAGIDNNLFFESMQSLTNTYAL